MGLSCRALTLAELPAAVELAYALTLEGPLGAMLSTAPAACEARRARLWGVGSWLIGDETLLGAFSGEHLIGIIGLAITQHTLTGETLAQEVVFYVTPTYRKGTAWRRLLRAAEACALRKNCSMLQISAPVEVSARLSPYYVKRGYTAVEVHFAKELVACPGSSEARNPTTRQP